MFPLSCLLLFFRISAAWFFHNLCSSSTGTVVSPCRMVVFPGLRQFHSGLESSLLKWSKNGEWPLFALGNVLWWCVAICMASCHGILGLLCMIFFIVLFRKLCTFSILPLALGFQGLDWKCLKANAFDRFFQCSLMKLVPLSDKNFSVHPNGRYTL